MASRNALTFIFITVLIDMIGFGIIIPVMPTLLMEITQAGIGEAAIWGGRLLAIYAVMQFFFAPIIGNLSDRFGRRPVLLASLITYGIDYVIMGFAPTLGWLFLGRMLAGISGSSHTTANAFIADVSSPEDRAKNFGLMGAAFGVGFIMGPALGGLLGEVDSRLPFFAAAGLAFANALYGYFVVPESLAPEKRRAFTFARANPIGMFVQIGSYPLVIGLFVALFFYQFAHDSLPSTWSYYTMLAFDWSPWDVGMSLAAVGLLSALVQGLLIRAVIPRIGEARAVILGFCAMAFGFAGFAFASKAWVLYAFLLPFSLQGLAGPAMRSILASRVPANAQGELQGAMASLISVTAIFAPWTMTGLFGHFTSADAVVYFPGAPLLLAALLSGAALVRFLVASRAGRLTPLATNSP